MLEILYIGSSDPPEFAEARRQIEDSARITVVSDVAAALRHAAAGDSPPELVVLAQQYPGEFSTAELDELQRRVPLARVVALLGSWTEGETRTGDPWPAAARVYWHRFRPYLSAELRRRRQGLCPMWGQPVTAGEEERALLHAEESIVQRDGLIGISASSGAMASWLSDACFAAGWSTIWLSETAGMRIHSVKAIVWDGTRADAREARLLAALSQKWQPAPIVALLDNPRIDDRRRALDAGASEIISKPLELDDLYWALDQWTGDSHSEPTEVHETAG